MFNFFKKFNSNIEDNDDLFNTLYENETKINPYDDASFIESVKLASCYDLGGSSIYSQFAKKCDTEAEISAYTSSLVGQTFVDSNGKTHTIVQCTYRYDSIDGWRTGTLGYTK